MDALHVRPRWRLAPVFEWVVAVCFLVATVTVAAMIVQQLRPSPEAATLTVPRPPVASVPAVVPPRAVSVPVLPFSDGKEIRVGETVSEVASRLGRAAEVGRQEVDRGRLGERLTRFYDYAGARFIIVFEPFERDGEVRVAAIYLP